MPELPEVETVRRGLEPVMPGRRIEDVLVRRRDLRVPVPGNFRAAVAGRKIARLDRRGKYILAMLEGGGGFGLHLGMSGRVKIEPPSAGAGSYAPHDYAPHDHVVFVMEGGTKIIFNDPRRFGMIFHLGEKWREEKPFVLMGPEPLGADFSAAGLAARLEGKNAPVKTALLDQAVVAGVGNIYACEALFRAGIDPRRKAKDIRGERLGRLTRAVRDVLEAAIEAGGSTLRDHRKTNGEMGYFQHSFSVYDREGKPCPSCTCDPAKTGGILRIAQAGRSTFYCPGKQK